MAAAFVERKNFDLSVKAGGHEQELVAGGRFEVESSDWLEMLMKDVYWEQSVGLAISSGSNVPQGDASVDETSCQDAVGTTFLVPRDLRDLQEIIAVEEHVVLLQLTNRARFDG